MIYTGKNKSWGKNSIHSLKIKVGLSLETKLKSGDRKAESCPQFFFSWIKPSLKFNKSVTCSTYKPDNFFFFNLSKFNFRFYLWSMIYKNSLNLYSQNTTDNIVPTSIHGYLVSICFVKCVSKTLGNAMWKHLFPRISWAYVHFRPITALELFYHRLQFCLFKTINAK